MKAGEKMIELKEYSLTELKEVLGISKRQWEERKEELLNYLKFFFDYELKPKGRGYCFNIKEQYTEYKPLPRKTRLEEITNFYEQEVEHILIYKPRNTGSNLAREITHKNNKYNHASGTAENYIRPFLKKNYSVSNKEWCYIDYVNFSYEPLNEEQLKYLKEQFEKYLNSNNIADTIAEQEAGYISKEKAYEQMRSKYNTAINSFKKKYGFRPYKAGELQKCAWTEEKEE